MKRVTVDKTGKALICVHMKIDNGRMWCHVKKSEALQLVKDLLEACNVSYIMGGEPSPQAGRGDRAGDLLLGVAGPLTASLAAQQKEPDAPNGMTLDEIQDAAERIQERCIGSGGGVKPLAMLIANLAAEIKKRGPDLGDRIVCSCGQVHRYQKIVK